MKTIDRVKTFLNANPGSFTPQQLADGCKINIKAINACARGIRLEGLNDRVIWKIPKSEMPIGKDNSLR